MIVSTGKWIIIQTPTVQHITTNHSRPPDGQRQLPADTRIGRLTSPHFARLTAGFSLQFECARINALTLKYLLIPLIAMLIAGCATTQRYEILDSGQRERLLAENDVVFEGEVVGNQLKQKRNIFGLYPILARMPSLMNPSFEITKEIRGSNGLERIDFKNLEIILVNEQRIPFSPGSEYLAGHRGKSFGKYQHLQFILLKAWDEE